MAAEEEIEEIRIENDEDAQREIQRIFENTLPEDAIVIFDGWPKISLRLEGEDFDQSLTPHVMQNFVDAQAAINRLYANLSGRKAHALTADERERLQIVVHVNAGSSLINIDFSNLGESLSKLGDNMSSKSKIAIVALVGSAIVGWKYLDGRTQERVSQIQGDVQIAQLARISSVAEKAINANDRLAERLLETTNNRQLVEDTQKDVGEAIIKSLTKADEAEFDGTTLDPEGIRESIRVSRTVVDEQVFRTTAAIRRVDPSDPDKTMVRMEILAGPHRGKIVDAEVRDQTLDMRVINTLKNSEWSRNPFRVAFKGKLIKGEIRSAVLTDAAVIKNVSKKKTLARRINPKDDAG